MNSNNKMKEDELIHIRLSSDMLEKIETLVKKGFFSNKNEAFRSVIRDMILKYKDFHNK